MTYATRQDMEARFRAIEISNLDEDDTRVGPALADAAAEIDSALAERYSLPLPVGTYPVLVGLQCDLARERLYDDGDIDAVKMAGQRARKQLKRLRDGDDRLIDAAGAAVPTRVRVRRAGPDPAMSASALEGL